MMRAGFLSRLARPLLRPLRKPLRTATTAGPRTADGAQQLRNPSKEQMQATSYLMDALDLAPTADSLIDALHAGANLLHSDAVIPLNEAARRCP